jgi:hypothetical protein
MTGINTCCLPHRSSKTGRDVSVPEVSRLEMTLRNKIVQCSCKASWQGLLCPRQWTRNFLTSWATKILWALGSINLIGFGTIHAAFIHLIWKWIYGLPHTRQMYWKQMSLIALDNWLYFLQCYTNVVHAGRTWLHLCLGKRCAHVVTHCPDTVLDEIRDMPLMECPCVVIMGMVHYSHSKVFSGVRKLGRTPRITWLVTVLAETELTLWRRIFF